MGQGEVKRLNRQIAELRAQLAHWEHSVGPCRNCGWQPSDELGEDDPFDRRVGILALTVEPARTILALSWSICPIHLVDYAICFDDGNLECAQLRAEHPEHDT